MKIYLKCEELYTSAKTIVMILLYPIFSNLSYIYVYLILNFSKNEYHNFAQNVDTVHQLSDQPKIQSRLQT